MNELLPLDKTSSPGNWKVTKLAPLFKNSVASLCVHGQGDSGMVTWVSDDGMLYIYTHTHPCGHISTQ